MRPLLILSGLYLIPSCYIFISSEIFGDGFVKNYGMLGILVIIFFAIGIFVALLSYLTNEYVYPEKVKRITTYVLLSIFSIPLIYIGFIVIYEIFN